MATVSWRELLAETERTLLSDVDARRIVEEACGDDWRLRLDEPATRDLGGLMLAVILGLIYIDFMAVLVIWYGDLPRKVDWFALGEAREEAA